MKIISSFLLILAFSVCNAQQQKKFSSQIYTINEGLLVNRIVDVIEDENGFMLISSGAGLQRFDGNKFETINPQPGLPETNHPHFFKLKNGEIWLSYYQGISVYNTLTNKYHIIFKNEDKNSIANSDLQQYEISPMMPKIECGDLVWCWSEYKHQFVGINKFNHHVSDSFQLTGPYVNGSINLQSNSAGLIFFNWNEGFGKIDLSTKTFQFIHTFPGFPPVINLCAFKNTVISATTKGMYKTDIVSGTTERFCNYPFPFDKEPVSQISFNKLKNDLYLLSINDQLYVMNLETGSVLYHMTNDQGKAFVELGYVNFCLMDHFQHLWVVTRVHGLVKIDFNKQGIKYFGEADAHTNFTRCIYPDKKSNLIIAGQLYNQISVYDTNQNLIRQFKVPPNSVEATVSCILKIMDHKYLVFLYGDHHVYMLDANKWKFEPVPDLDPFISYYTTLQPINDSTAFLFDPSGSSILHTNKSHIYLTPLVANPFALCGLIDRDQKLWLGATGKYFIFSGKKLENEDILSLKENVVTKCLMQDKAGNIWMGTERGLYKLNGTTGEILWVYKTADGLSDENVYSITEDEAGNIWFSTNKGISCLNKDGEVINIFASDGLQGSEFNGNSLGKADDGELYFGGLNGFNSFYPGIIKTIAKKPEVVMTKINVMDASWQGDTASWNLHEMILPFTQNVISFSFTALGWYNPGVYNYQYRMIGIDKDWVNAGNLGYARYVLPPGRYTFEYSADNRFEKSIQHPKYIIIDISPPYWKTTLFKTAMIFLVALLVVLSVRIYDRQKYRKQLRKLELKQTVQQERQRISRDLHDNIGAYATVLIASAEKLHQRQEEHLLHQSATKVSENARNIMNSLQETIWVLNNDAITITDFADRFKIFSKKMIQNFTGVQIKFIEELTNDITLSPSEALNIFRIMQEALQNSVKHSLANHIFISFKSDTTLNISLKDNGKGFNVNSIAYGNGLQNMQFRAREAGYEFLVFSDNKGTDVRLNKIT